MLLKNVHTLSPLDGIDEVLDILIVDGIIKDIGKAVKIKSEVDVLDLSGKTAVPGLFDMHVHFREPGQTHKEDNTSGAMAAANGGFTGVLCMPNTSPPIDNAVLLSELKRRCEGSVVDIEFAACATKNRQGEEIAPLLSLSKAGAAAVTDDGSPIHNPEILRRVMEYGAQTGLPVIQHCEDMSLSSGGVVNEGLISTVTGLRGIPSVSETSVVARDIQICSYIPGARYHVQHISCAGSVKLIREAKVNAIAVTGEVCPHHFLLTDESCLDYDTNFKMNPPLRTPDDIQEIVNGLADGTIDVICTDHAPHTDYEKSQGFDNSPFGITGLETSFGLSYTFLVKTGILTFEELVRKMSVNPRRILGLEDIHIAKGHPANLSILCLKSQWTVRKSKFLSRSSNTPFDGYRLTGKPFMVINNGKLHYSTL